MPKDSVELSSVVSSAPMHPARLDNINIKLAMRARCQGRVMYLGEYIRYLTTTIN